MSKSLIACAIVAKECALVRLKTSGDNGYSLSLSKTLPFGLGDFTRNRGKQLLKKLDSQLNEWPDEELALCIGPKNYLTLPASFPANASSEECRKYCAIEAKYFLCRPEEYDCDFIGYGDSSSGRLEKKILLFYLAEPSRTISEHLSTNHRIVFRGTPQQPLLHLSKHMNNAQFILELENNFILLTVSKNGRIEKFSCREVKNRKEIEYFTIRKLIDNPLCHNNGVQVTGTMADKAMTKLIQKETSITLKQLTLPPSIAINNPQKLPVSSAAAVKAISTALMALSNNKEFTLSTQ
ncbi:MAG: hypothetical protein HGA20_16330 [Geobacteraceae bacterium]|nr:hypothetical protein [Geobacteraceae bacterium]